MWLHRSSDVLPEILALNEFLQREWRLLHRKYLRALKTNVLLIQQNCATAGPSDGIRVAALSIVDFKTQRNENA